MGPPLATKARAGLLWNGIEIAGGRAIALLRMLVLARLLVPDDFGLFAVAFVATETAMGLTNFGLKAALTQLPTIGERHYDVAWTCEMLRAAVVTVALVLSAPLIADFAFGAPLATDVLRLLAVTPLIDSAVSIKIVRLTRSLHFRPHALISLAGHVTHTLVAVALSRSIGVWAMATGLLCGGAVQVVVSYLLAPHRPRICFDWEALHSLLRFGRGFFGAELARVLGGATLQVVISRQLGAADLGVYFLATRLAFVPRDLIQFVGRRVIFALYTRLQDDAEGTVWAFRSTLKGMGVFLVPAYVLAIALAPALVGQVLGSRWLGAVPLIRVLGIVGIIGVLMGATIPMLQGRGRTGWVAATAAARSTVVVVVAWVMASHFGLLGAGLAWLLGEIAATGLVVALVGRLIPRPFSELGTGAAIIVLASGVAAVTAIAVERMVPGVFGFVGAVTAGTVSAGLIAWRFRRSLGLEVPPGSARSTSTVSEILRTLGGQTRSGG